ncbi:luciferin 4-monooxygenase-like [Schistocerca americana]|uniref:luciferin 4-monooxygenase-like n=1 Tax=Schistocerca americana TaxID=7009 RepID=UPI001F4F7246|nr:luciferin 4-monooxygenase-like [Schistocerca americana]XP_047122010.1 luciferin 4-monooxygenase-like [Schistocerca piceifrons]
MSPYAGVRLGKMSPQPNLEPLRAIMFVGSPIDRPTLLELETKFRLRAVQVYGMTEVLMTLSDTRNNPAPLGSVGRPQPTVEIKVVDTQTGEALGPGKEGELCFRGPMVTRGYYNDPAATAAAIDADGWFHTGDVGYYDASGLFYVTDRIKDFIKYKGEHVPSAHLEATLLKHPAVLEAAVVGIPNPETTELPRAYVVVKPGVDVSAEELVSFVSKEVSDHKKLRGGVIFLDKLPRTATGKTFKRILRELATKDVDE